MNKCKPKLVALDVETHLIPAEGKIRTSFQVPDLVLVSAASFSENCPTPNTITYNFRQMNEFFAFMEELEKSDSPPLYTAHHGAFDIAVLARWYDELVELFKNILFDYRYLDTEVMTKLRYPLRDRRTTLAAAAKHVLNLDLDKGPVRLSFRRDRDITAAMLRYAQTDAEVTGRLCAALKTIPYGGLVDQPFRKLIATAPDYRGPAPDELYSTAHALLGLNLEPVGLSVDRDRVKSVYDELSQEVNVKLAYLVGEDLARIKRLPKAPIHADSRSAAVADSRWRVSSINPPRLIRRKGKQVQRVDGHIVLNEKALRAKYAEVAREANIVPPVSPGGALSLRYDFWKLHKDKLPEGLRAHFELGKARKYLSSFVQALTDYAPERVYPHYVIPGAETGRWACYGPNLQQLPKKLRNMYVAPEGSSFISADYKSLELYTLAQAMSAMGIEGKLKELLEEGADIHKIVSDQLGISRQEAKAANFGLPGGMGALRFYEYCTQQCSLKLSFTETRALRNLWFHYFPDIRNYLDGFSLNPWRFKPDDVSAADWLVSLFPDFDPDYSTWPSHFQISKRLQAGKLFTTVLPSGRAVPLRRFSEAANVFFQGIGAEVITLAFNLVCQADLRVVAVIHDSITIQVDNDGFDEAVRLIHLMRQAQKNICCNIENIPTPEYTVSKELT